ncbi:6-phosphogluconolactonase [Lactococcus lactis subsp. lactis IO-1]|nr:6-phosphogluconolactonase [Lactococcus lactis subsp. lactis IO-1]
MMKFSQVQDLEYLFKRLKINKNIVFNLNGRLATAKFINYDEQGSPVKFYTRGTWVGYHKEYRFDDIYNSYFDHFVASTISYDNPSWVNTPLFALQILSNFVQEREAIKSEFKHILYNVRFLDSEESYDFYLVDNDYDFEILSLID